MVSLNYLVPPIGLPNELRELTSPITREEIKNNYTRVK